MQRDPRTYLWEAWRAASLAADFVASRSWADYGADPMLRSAVERQLTIVGEALNQLRQADEDLAARIPDLVRIVAFRNVLVHGYAALDDRLVWEVASERLLDLVALLDGLVGDGV